MRAHLPVCGRYAASKLLRRAERAATGCAGPPLAAQRSSPLLPSCRGGPQSTGPGELAHQASIAQCCPHAAPSTRACRLQRSMPARFSCIHLLQSGWTRRAGGARECKLIVPWEHHPRMPLIYNARVQASGGFTPAAWQCNGRPRPARGMCSWAGQVLHVACACRQSNSSACTALPCAGVHCSSPLPAGHTTHQHILHLAPIQAIHQ